MQCLVFNNEVDCQTACDNIWFNYLGAEFDKGKEVQGDKKVKITKDKIKKNEHKKLKIRGKNAKTGKYSDSKGLTTAYCKPIPIFKDTKFYIRKPVGLTDNISTAYDEVEFNEDWNAPAVI